MISGPSGGNFLNRLRACVSASGVETTVHTMKDSYVVDFERINQESLTSLPPVEDGEWGLRWGLRWGLQ